MRTDARAGKKGADVAARPHKLRLATVEGAELARRLAAALFERFQAAFHIEGTRGSHRRVYLSDADFYGGHDRMRAFVAGWLKGQQGDWVEVSEAAPQLCADVWAMRGKVIELVRYIGVNPDVEPGKHSWLVIRGAEPNCVVFDYTRWCHLTPPIPPPAGGRAAKE